LGLEATFKTAEIAGYGADHHVANLELDFGVGNVDYPVGLCLRFHVVV
jgi:hypothetical protein